MQPFESKMVHILAGRFLMDTSERQVDRLAQTFDLAKKWREKGCFGRE